MAQMIFHTQDGEAILKACEREHLAHLARLIPANVWDITNLSRCDQIMALIPRERGTEYLHTMHDQVKAAHLDQHMSAIHAATNGGVVAALNNRMVTSISLALRATGNGVPLLVPITPPARLRSLEVEFNTTLAAGNDILRLATKLYGWAASHTWIAEEHREWAADLIQSGLDQGIYRAGLWSTDQRNQRVWLDTGWADVIALLRGGPGPVVLSTSTDDPFPNPDLETWMSVLPDDVTHTAEQRRTVRQRRYEEWGQLTNAQCWEAGMAYLTEYVPYLQLSPNNLATNTFGPAVTVFDLLSAERHDNIRRVVADYETNFGPWAV